MSAPEPAPRLIDVPGRLEDHVGVLGVALATWATRDDSKAQPGIRQAANTAMDAIDAMLAELHRARASLVTEIRQADEASAARVDALLTERRLRASALAQQMTRGDRRDRGQDGNRGKIGPSTSGDPLQDP